MENAVDALKIAFSVIVFVIALSLAMNMFSEARATADAVLYKTDKSHYIDYEGYAYGLTDAQKLQRESRIVGLETVIPTLYKYYNENYTVIFKENSTPKGYMKLYNTKRNGEAGYYNPYYGGTSDKICSFDLDEETRRNEPWVGNKEYCKKNLDAFLSGGTFYFPSGTRRIL